MAKANRQKFVPKPTPKSVVVSGYCRNPGCNHDASRRRQLYKPLLVCGRCINIGGLLAKLWPFYVNQQDQYLANLLAEFERQEAEDEDEPGEGEPSFYEQVDADGQG